MALAQALGWPNSVQVVVAIALAFVFGYSLTIWPVLRAGLSFREATGVALAADTVSIVIMETVDNVFVLLVPGAIDAGLGDALFWWPIALGFAIAWPFAFLAQRALIKRGRGHVHHAAH